MRKDETSFDTSSMALYRTIFSASSEGMAIVGPNACFVEVNPAFGRLFGKEPEQIAGMSCLELFCHEGTDGQRLCSNARMVVKALQEQRALPSVEMNCTVDGSPRSLAVEITPVSGADETLCLLIAREVKTIDDASRLHANFLSMIAHELRSPLNTIHGYLDLALMGTAGDLNEQQHEFVQRARASSEHLYALLEDLLLISRADSGQVRLNREVINLQDIITDAVEEMEFTLSDHAVTVDIQLPADLPPMYADIVRMQQVVRNLVSNALRFTSAGGQITISASITSHRDERSAEIVVDEEEQKLLKLQVSDTGSGIDADALEHIFEHFYQLPRTHAGRSSRGQGLGLTIVKMIVELHGGQITVASTPGQGTTFTCLLPCLLS